MEIIGPPEIREDSPEGYFNIPADGRRYAECRAGSATRCSGARLGVRVSSALRDVLRVAEALRADGGCGKAT